MEDYNFFSDIGNASQAPFCEFIQILEKFSLWFYFCFNKWDTKDRFPLAEESSVIVSKFPIGNPKSKLRSGLSLLCIILHPRGARKPRSTETIFIFLHVKWKRYNFLFNFVLEKPEENPWSWVRWVWNLWFSLICVYIMCIYLLLHWFSLKVPIFKYVSFHLIQSRLIEYFLVVLVAFIGKVG